MNANAILAALNTVEQDHDLVLNKVRALKEAVSGVLAAPDLSSDKILERFRNIHRFFTTQFEDHLREEEHTLFPLLVQQLPGGAEVVARLRREHEEIRSKREDLGNCLHVAGELEDYLPDMVMRDMLTYGWRLWEMLDNHAHAETKAVQQCLTRCLAAKGSGAA
jgi:hemerythrin-like domain-containing protein